MVDDAVAGGLHLWPGSSQAFKEGVWSGEASTKLFVGDLEGKFCLLSSHLAWNHLGTFACNGIFQSEIHRKSVGFLGSILACRLEGKSISHNYRLVVAFCLAVRTLTFCQLMGFPY